MKIMIKCKKCGKDLTPDSSFCSMCGSSISKMPPVRTFKIKGKVVVLLCVALVCASFAVYAFNPDVLGNYGNNRIT